MIHSRLSQPPITSPAWILMRSFSGMLISSSTVQGLLTCPLMLKSLVPLFLVRPKLANQSPPRLQIVGATATVSTLVTVVGQPNTPTSAGNGGFRRGLPCFPSRDSIRAGSSVDEQVKVVSAAAGVLAQEPGLVSLSDGHLEVAGLVVELSSDVDISSPGPHGPPGHQTSLNQ